MTQEPTTQDQRPWEVIVIGGGLAGLSAAVYLGRSKRRTLLVESGHSMAVWEPDVQNYLGFPEGISGEDLLLRGRQQADRFGTEFAQDEITAVKSGPKGFTLQGQKDIYRTRRLLLATGLTHMPPEIPEVRACLGCSLFFCKDCDGYRVHGGRIGIVGHNNEAVNYALAMLFYSPTVVIITNGQHITWDKVHAGWIEEYQIPVYEEPVVDVEHTDGQIGSVGFKNDRRIAIDYLFATRGDLCHSQLARSVGAKLNAQEEIEVNEEMRTSVEGMYAAGCVTPANCQMIIAAGQGATAAQAIIRDLLEEDLRTHSLRRYRETQMRYARTEPEVLE
jgi:thioredoxin reductase (NADPH)